MFKRLFLFPDLAIFLHSTILHYTDSLWIKKTMAETIYCLLDYEFNLFYYNNRWGYTEIFLLLVILISFYVTK